MPLRALASRFERNVRADPTFYTQCRGDELARPIYWEGRQWTVTDAGLQCRDGTYLIEKTRLWDEEGQWGLVNHLSEKDWVDLEDFVVALTPAREKFKDLYPFNLVNVK